MATHHWLVLASAVLMGGCAGAGGQVCPVPMPLAELSAAERDRVKPSVLDMGGGGALSPNPEPAAVENRKVKMMERRLKEREREIAALTVQLETLKQIDTDRTRKRAKPDAAP
jgi:hypothetical protein